MLDPEIAPCKLSQSFITPIVDSFTVQTDQYQAMYRVLNTFSLLNAILSTSY